MQYPLLRNGTPVSEDKIKKLAEALEFLNTFLADSKYVAGSTSTVADISLFTSITTLQVLKTKRDNFVLVY